MMIGKFKADEEGGYTGELNALGLTIEDMTFCPVKDNRDDGAHRGPLPVPLQAT